jgi:hypothetical protein
MGSRINFVFDDGTDALTVLYSHWGQSNWEEDLIGALVHAQKRKGDYSYFTRMVISHLIKDYVLDETGFGIYSVPRSELDSVMFEQTVILDLVNNTLTDLDNNNTIDLYGKVFA